MRSSEEKTSRPAPPTLQQALAKIQRYCAYQERSHQEVKSRLFEYGLYSNQVDELLSTLITDGFLNEERFAKAYAGGKFRMQKWGKLKIQRELEQHGLTGNCIARGMKEIDSRDYAKTLKDLLTKKSSLVSEKNLFRKRDKIARFAIAKGFEPDLVWEMVRQLFPDQPSFRLPGRKKRK